MQFTTGLLTIALAVAGAAAAPGVQERQVDNLLFLQFYTEPDCQGTLIDSRSFVDNGANDVCRLPNPNPVTYPSFRVRQNGIKRNAIIRGGSDCNSGASATVTPTTPINTCFTQQVGSVKFVN